MLKEVGIKWLRVVGCVLCFAVIYGYNKNSNKNR